MVPCGGNRDVRAWRPSCVRADPCQRTPVRTGTRSLPAASKAESWTTAAAPIAGAMVSVVGRTTAAATTDRDGRYTLRELPLRSVHPERALARLFQVARAHGSAHHRQRFRIPEIQLARATAQKAPAATRSVDAARRSTAARRLRSSADASADRIAAAATADDAAEDEPMTAKRENCLAAAASAAQHSEGRRDRAVWADR